MDRRYRQTRDSAPEVDDAAESVKASSSTTARKRAKSALAQRRRGRRSSQTGAEAQARKAEVGRRSAAVFEEYGSGDLGSGDESISQLRREAYFRPDPRDL
jgi:hypothetical protein